jgi:hypothetical protein
MRHALVVQSIDRKRSELLKPSLTILRNQIAQSLPRLGWLLDGKRSGFVTGANFVIDGGMTRYAGTGFSNLIATISIPRGCRRRSRLGG